MHPKYPIPDTQKTDIIYHWKCPAHNCTAEYICETNRSLKGRVSDHKNKAIRNHHISIKHPKVELKDFTIVDRDNDTLHHSAKENLLKPHTQQEELNSSISPPKGAPLHSLSTQKTINTSHLPDLHLQ